MPRGVYDRSKMKPKAEKAAKPAKVKATKAPKLQKASVSDVDKTVAPEIQDALKQLAAPIEKEMGYACYRSQHDIVQAIQTLSNTRTACIGNNELVAKIDAEILKVLPELTKTLIEPVESTALPESTKAALKNKSKAPKVEAAPVEEVEEEAPVAAVEAAPAVIAPAPVPAPVPAPLFAPVPVNGTPAPLPFNPPTVSQ